MHVKAKKMAFGGLLLALTVVCMALGSIIETNTLFLLAAASFFVGIVIREAGLKTGAAFYIAGVLLGLILAPNKLYVISYAAMGFYILAMEAVYKRIGKMKETATRFPLFWAAKFAIFNLLYIPSVVGFQRLLFSRELTPLLFAGALVAGQAGLLIYDRAYEYVQGRLYGKLKKWFV